MISLKKVNKVQLVFPGHNYGHLAREKEVAPLISGGLLLFAGSKERMFHLVEKMILPA